ncbi:MAG: DNA polymerase III subunit delta [Armatimonadetes bacterium]|nr:DNA polymerase III subunit delta [Armatimonadota bacterium]
MRKDSKAAGEARRPAASRSRPDFSALQPLYVFHGREEGRKREWLDALVEAAKEAGAEEFDREVLNADELTGDRIAASATTLPFFSPKRLVVVRGADRLRAADQARLIPVLSRLPETTCLALVTAPSDAEERSRRKTVFSDKMDAALKQAGAVFIECSPLKEPEAAAWAREESLLYGKQIDAATAAEFARLCAADIGIMRQELEKLSLYVGDRKAIALEDVKAMIGEQVEDKVFALVDAIGNRDRALAFSLLEKMLPGTDKAERTTAMRLSAMILRQFRLIWQAKVLADHRALTAKADAVPPQVAALLPEENNLLSILQRQAWQAGKLGHQAAAFSWPQLEAALERIYAADLSLKGIEGEIKAPRLGLELMIADLCAGRG